MVFDGRTAALHFAVRPTAILHYLGQLLLVSAALMTVPLIVAFAVGSADVGLRYVIACGLLAGMGGFGATRRKPEVLQKNEALCVVGLTFLLSSVIAAIPLTAYGLSPLDAWFDAVSAVTTTGLSTVPSVNDLPYSFHFGRSWAQWVGGLGVMVLSLAVMMQPGVATRHMGFDAREADDVAGGTRSHARHILIAYVAVTLGVVLVIWAAGMSLPFALTHGLAAISTGGFAARDSSLGGLPPIQISAVTFACFLGALPFYLYYRKLYRDWRSTALDPQLLTLCGVILLGIAVVYGFTALYRNDAGLGTLGDAAAMTVSAQSTAGFATTAPGSMGTAATLVLCMMMLVGGGLGSTAGGIKILRFIVLVRLFQLLLVRCSTTQHTQAKIRLGSNPVSQLEIEAILGVVFAYILTIVVSWMVFLAAGYDPVPALFEVTSAVGTAGLSDGVTSSSLHPGLKLVLILDMLLGRVETVALIVLLFPGTWFGPRRKI